MNLLHLQYFHAVANERSFTKASQTLRINQAALSRMVKQLETYFGFDLLERHARGVRLTPRGEEVFSKATDIFSKVTDLQLSTGTLLRVCKGELLIGTSDLLACELLAKIVRNQVSEWPEVYPNIQVGTSTEIIDRVARGLLEVALLFHVPELPVSLAITKRFATRFHLVVHKKFAKNVNTLSRFIGSREIDNVLNQHFPTLDKWKKKCPKAKIAFSSNSLQLHMQLVMGGFGISVLPSWYVEKHIKAGRLVDLLPEQTLIFNLKVIQRKNVELSLVVQDLLQRLIF